MRKSRKRKEKVFFPVFRTIYDFLRLCGLNNYFDKCSDVFFFSIDKLSVSQKHVYFIYNKNKISNNKRKKKIIFFPCHLWEWNIKKACNENVKRSPQFCFCVNKIVKKINFHFLFSIFFSQVDAIQRIIFARA